MLMLCEFHLYSQSYSKNSSNHFHSIIKLSVANFADLYLSLEIVLAFIR